MFRKRSLAVLIIAVVLMLAPTMFAGVAVGEGGADSSGRSLSADASFVAVAPSAPAAAGESLPLVPDGGFENGPPPASLWTETTSTTCEWILDPTAVWGIPAPTGVYAFWAGGYCGVPNTDLVSQSVAVPSGTRVIAALQTVFYRPDMDDPTAPDYFLIRANSTIVGGRPMIQANDTYPAVAPFYANLSSFAGTTVNLQIIGFSSGDLTGNVLVDQVGLFVLP
jgi:hypothetical protein